MKRFKLLPLLALPLLLLGCADEPEVETIETDVIEAPLDAPMAEEPMGAMGEAVTADFVALQGMGHEGQIMLTPMGNQTQVMVQLSGPEEGVHEGHIHTGSDCDNLGNVVVPLEPVTVGANQMGTTTSTVDLAPAMVMDGNHLVAYHVAGGDPGQPVVCAEIPQEGEMRM